MQNPLKTLNFRHYSSTPLQNTSITISPIDGVDIGLVSRTLNLIPNSVRLNGYFISSTGPRHVSSSLSWAQLLDFFAQKGLPRGTDRNGDEIVVHGTSTDNKNNMNQLSKRKMEMEIEGCLKKIKLERGEPSKNKTVNVKKRVKSEDMLESCLKKIKLGETDTGTRESRIVKPTPSESVNRTPAHGAFSLETSSGSQNDTLDSQNDTRDSQSTSKDEEELVLPPSKKQKYLEDDEGEFNTGAYFFDEEVARKEFVLMIIMHEYPLNIVDNIGLRRFVGTMQPLFNFKTITQDTIIDDVMKIYKHERTKVMKLIKNSKSRVAITIDMWILSNQKKGFMTVTAHFVDASWSLQTRILRFIYIPYPYTSKILCEELIDCLVDWNLNNKTSTITLNNSSKNNLLMDLVSSKLKLNNNILLDGKLLHIKCCADILNQIAKTGLNVISNAIEKIRESITFWLATPERYKKFKETVHGLKIGSSKKLTLDCKTKWKSTFSMLNIAILYKDAFKLLKQEENLYECVPLEEDWETVAQICDKLKLFHDISELFSKTNHLAPNISFLKFCEIRMSLKEWSHCGKPFIETMAIKMIEIFEKYHDQIYGIMGVASILDPMCKLKFLEFHFNTLYEDNIANLQIEKIRKIVYGLEAEYASKLKVNHGEKHNYNNYNPPQFGLMVEFHKFLATQYENVNPNSELDRYLNERVIPMQNDFDILDWWKKNARKYPILRLMARDFLAIPVSIVDSESNFYTKRIVSAHCSSVPHYAIEALVCTKNWLSAEMKDSSSADSGELRVFLDEEDEEAEVESDAEANNHAN